MFGQLSPGDLVEVHKHLEGMTNCTQCHVLGEKVTNQKCLDCHGLIQDLIREGKGYHVSSDVEGKDCFTCHSDHHGRGFQIIRFDTENFNHDLTAYELKGKHLELECKKCHQKKFISDPKVRKGSFLGLGVECLSCHDDYHQGTLSSDCMSCHNFDSFSPVAKFDHQSAAFPLIGKHQETECVKCHFIETRNGKDFQKFAGVAFENCTACHEDVHANKFGQNCRQCHNENSFNVVADLNDFDHRLTNFALEDKHLEVDCKSCHKGSFTNPVAHEKCTDCHADFHRGQFADNNRISDCDDCHSVAGFRPSSFTIERHNRGKFNLEGAHLATPCFLCHQKDSQWEFKSVRVACVDCHENIHRDFISDKFKNAQNCDACHSVAQWNDVGFDHNRTDFTLEGKHTDLSCRSCHFMVINEKIEQQFKTSNKQCESCHVDVHRSQFKKDGQALCESCHGFDSWEAKLFNHDLTRFKLEGKHTELECLKCHPAVADPSGKYIRYKLFEEIKCENCHF